MALPKPTETKKVNLDFNKEFINTFTQNIEKGNVEFINQTLKDLHEADVANLIENLSPDTRTKLIEIESFNIDPEIFIELNESIQSEVLQLLSIESLIKSSKEQNLFNNFKYNISNLTKEKIETHFFQNFDMVILDPPRAGAIIQVTSLGKSKVKKIIYISCNIQTFLRDSIILLSFGYKIKYILPIDQFLYTSHLEIFSVFEI